MTTQEAVTVYAKEPNLEIKTAADRIVITAMQSKTTTEDSSGLETSSLSKENDELKTEVKRLQIQIEELDEIS